MTTSDDRPAPSRVSAPPRPRRGRAVALLVVLVVLAAVAVALVVLPRRSLVTSGEGSQHLRYLSAARPLPPGFFGIDGESIRPDAMGTVWNDPPFAARVAGFVPGNLRIFGGSVANTWDWRAGQQLDNSPGVPAGTLTGHPNPSIPLQTFARVVRTSHAAAVFDLNIETDTLSSQILMLTTARSLGVPIRRVELGNEFYLPAYARYFPDATAYARKANLWITALHQTFPGVQVAVVAEDATLAATARGRAWNRQLFATVRGEDAVTLHEYSRVHDLVDPHHPGVDAILDSPSRRWSSLAGAGLASVPAGLPIWVTEWGYLPTDVSGRNPWAHALGAAYFGIRLATNPRVQLTDFHALVDDFPYGFGVLHVSPASARTTPDYRTTAVGHALAPLFRTLDGCRSVRLVGVGDRPSGDRTLIGIACVRPSVRIYLVNPTASAQTLDYSALMPDATRVPVRSFALAISSQTNFAHAPAPTVIGSGSVTIPAWGVQSVAA